MIPPHQHLALKETAQGESTLERWTGKLELQEIAEELDLSGKTLWEKKKKLVIG